MNQKKAKAIRNEVYNGTPKNFRDYSYMIKKDSKGNPIKTKTIISDKLRREYKIAKKLNRKGGQ